MSICVIPGCENEITRNKSNRISKFYCPEHIYGIKIKCEVCKKELIITPGNYMKNIGKPIICRSCCVTRKNKSLKGKLDSAKVGKIWGTINISKYNKTLEGIKQTKENGEKWRNSEKGKEFAKNLGLSTWKENFKDWIGSEECIRIGTETLKKYNKSEAGKQHFVKIGLNSGIKNCEKWRNSEKGKEHSKNQVIKMNKINNNLFKIKLKRFLSMNISINLFLCNSFDKIIPAAYSSFSCYNKVPGVWAIWGENLDGIKVCLDVCQTKDIGNEMRYGTRKLIKHTQKKYKEFIKYKNIFFIPIKLNVYIFDERELIEALYAIKYNSIYWSTSFTQLKLLKMTKEEFKEYIISINKDYLDDCL